MSHDAKIVTCFMDGIDWQHEVGHASNGNRVFPTVDDLVHGAGHDLDECGIAEVEIRFVRWIKESKY